MRRHLRHLHLAGVEYGFLGLSGLPQRAGGTIGSGAGVSALGLAAFLAGGTGVRHAWTAVEYDDVDVRRLVLCVGVGSDFGVGTGYQAARHRLLYRAGDCAERYARYRLGDWRHVRGCADVRSTVLPPAAGMGRPFPFRGDGERHGSAIVAADVAAPYRAYAGHGGMVRRSAGALDCAVPTQ